MAKRRKKDNSHVWFAAGAILVIAIVLYYGGQQGWFKAPIGVVYNIQNFQNSSSFPINQINSNYNVLLDLNPNTICVGDYSTGKITSNTGAYTPCATFTQSGATTWQLYKTVLLDANGVYTEAQRVNTAGTAQFIAVCCDSQRQCGVSNIETLVVDTCSTPTPIPSAQPQGYQCTDSDGGKVYTVAGNCQDSYHQLGYSDSCNSVNSLKEFYCDAQNICQSEDVGCQSGWVCIQGACRQPACGGIPLPTGQSSCSVGYCTTGTCTFEPATLYSQARCGCA
jgi:hypothetical protein